MRLIEALRYGKAKKSTDDVSTPQGRGVSGAQLAKINAIVKKIIQILKLVDIIKIKVTVFLITTYHLFQT